MKKIIFLTFLTLTNFIRCSSASSDDENLQIENNSDKKTSGNSYEELVADYQDPSLPHPHFANAETTRKMLMTEGTPKTDELETCLKEMVAVGNQATTKQNMKNAVNQILTQVEENIKTYHWCFYRNISLLDWKLENDLTLYLDDKAKIFYDTMKYSWILAFSLERVSENPIYFNYLRLRYIEISKEHFARKVEIINDPFGSISQTTKVNGESKKPAREFEEDDDEE